MNAGSVSLQIRTHLWISWARIALKHEAMAHAARQEVLAKAPWRNLEEHISDLPERVDRSITASHELRRRYREELLA